MSARGRSLLRDGHTLADPLVQRQRLSAIPLDSGFEVSLSAAGLHPFRARSVGTLQINVGKLCNQTCRHCHVDAGPDRTEVMSRETMEACLEVIARHRIPVVDITGGAPEMNPHFRWLIEACAEHAPTLMHRCNLTYLMAPAGRDLPDLFACLGVEIIASLPHFRALNTDRQRGEGVHEKSIAALRLLNAVGYGREGGRLRLSLVTNPPGAVLPGGQASMEREWKRELGRLHGIAFNRLYTLANMPISRFLSWLEETGQTEEYLRRLAAAFNPAAAEGAMCRDMVSVGWDGRLYDCDFNQMLEMPLVKTDGNAMSIRDFDPAGLANRSIKTGPHCFGCTAGAGSSCTGATA